MSDPEPIAWPIRASIDGSPIDLLALLPLCVPILLLAAATGFDDVPAAAPGQRTVGWGTIAVVICSISCVGLTMGLHLRFGRPDPRVFVFDAEGICYERTLGGRRRARRLAWRELRSFDRVPGIGLWIDGGWRRFPMILPRKLQLEQRSTYGLVELVDEGLRQLDDDGTHLERVRERSAAGRRLFRDRRPVTAGMAGVIALSFILQQAAGPVPALPIWKLLSGAMSVDLVRLGEWDRLLLVNFLHKDAEHVLTNISSLVIPGLLLEPLVGRARMASIALGGGLVGILAGSATHPYVFAVGASAIPYAVKGGLLAAVGRLWRQLPISYALVVLGFSVPFALTSIATLIERDSGHHQGAHAFGAAGGLLIAALLTGGYDVQRRTPLPRTMGRCLAALAVLYASIVVTSGGWRYLLIWGTRPLDHVEGFVERYSAVPWSADVAALSIATSPDASAADLGRGFELLDQGSGRPHPGIDRDGIRVLLHYRQGEIDVALARALRLAERSSERGHDQLLAYLEWAAFVEQGDIVADIDRTRLAGGWLDWRIGLGLQWNDPPGVPTRIHLLASDGEHPIGHIRIVLPAHPPARWSWPVDDVHPRLIERLRMLAVTRLEVIEEVVDEASVYTVPIHDDDWQLPVIAR